jgi:predicted dehydrogenase
LIKGKVMSKPMVNIAMIGSGFMSRAHSNAFRQVRSFFDLPVEPVLKVLGARNPETGARVAEKFGWEEVVPGWREILDRPDIHIVDIGAPVHTHSEIAIAAMQAGKAVICEKPLAADLAQARQMVRVAEQTGALNLCMYNIRSTPAVAYARQLIQEGAIGRLSQWRAAFQQSWLVNPEFPLTWRLRKETAGSGALGDLGSHSLDLARFLVGEVEAVSAMMHTFTKERWIPLKEEGRNSIPSDKKGPVTVDDSVWSLLRFEEDVFGTMEATRMATGQLCANRFEVYGSEGGLAYDFMRLNELQFFSLNDPRPQQGWRTIHVTLPLHPYAGNWWPAGHSLGYEHSFTHMLADFFQAYARGEKISPDFADAARTQAVMEAVERSATCREWVAVEKV